MADIPLWTFTVDDGSTPLEAEVAMTAPVKPSMSEDLGVHPIIGRRDPRVIASGNVTTDLAFECMALSDAEDQNMTSVCEAGAVVTVTGPNTYTETVRIKTWSREVRSGSRFAYSISAVRSV
jgi:hypothetical protein